MRASSGSVLVTGANGFVGRAVANALAAEGDRRVVAAIRGKATSVPGATNVTVVPALDLENSQGWKEALEGVETVVHCAARVHVMSENTADPLAEFRKVNVEGTLSLARAAAETGVRRFIYLSSVKVLGESTDGRGPFTIGDQLAPEDPYGKSKAEAEIALRTFCDEQGMDLVIIRPPLVYGPGVGGNFSSLMKLANTPFPLPFGGLHNLRSLVYVENLADFIVHCVDWPGRIDQAFLVSDGEDLSTERLITLIRVGLGRPGRLISLPEGLFRLAGRVLGKSAVIDRLFGSLQVDSSESAGFLGWTPPYRVEEAISITARAFSGTNN